MEYADGKVKDLQIAYIGGGSRGWAWTFMTDLAMDEELSGTIRLYDIDAEAANTMRSSATDFLQERMWWANGTILFLTAYSQH